MDSFDLSRVPEHVVSDRVDSQLDRALAGAAVVPARRRAARILGRLGRADRRAPPAGSTIRFPLAVNPARFHPRLTQERLRDRLRVHRQLVGQGSGHPAGARAARGGAGGDLRQGLGEGAESRAVRPRRAALHRAAGCVLKRKAGARRHPGADAALRRAQRARVRRAGSRHAARDELRVRGARAVRRGIPRVEIRERRCARCWTSCWATSSAGRI